MEKIAIIGAGNGGLSFAGDLIMNGTVVHLYDKYEEVIKPIKFHGRIELIGPILNGIVPIHHISTSLERTIQECSILFIVTPAFAHREIANEIAPFLRPEQIIILHPGRTGGALEFRHILKQHGAHNTVAETQTLLYASRITGENQVTIYGKKKKVELAALPSGETENVVNKLNGVLPHFTAAPNIFYTSLHNIGAIFHPAPTVLNSARIENGNLPFEYYHDGITPSVAKILEQMDEERVLVAKGLGVDVPTAREWLFESYGIQESTLYDAIKTNKIYSGILAPSTLHVRYILEDVPMSLVPISCLGNLVGISTPAIDAIIELASILHQTNYREIGRNLTNLGLNGKIESICIN